REVAAPYETLGHASVFFKKFGPSGNWLDSSRIKGAGICAALPAHQVGEQQAGRRAIRHAPRIEPCCDVEMWRPRRHLSYERHSVHGFIVLVGPAECRGCNAETVEQEILKLLEAPPFLVGVSRLISSSDSQQVSVS